MNRKKTILMAVMINAALLVILSFTALSIKEESSNNEKAIAQVPIALPNLDEPPLYQDSPEIATLEPPQMAEEVAADEAPVHKLPPLTIEKSPIAKSLAEPTLITRPFFEIVVKKGDNLERLAKAHHTSVDEIIKLNHLPSSFLKIGQVLKIPTERSMASKKKEPNALQEPKYYTIKVGENPWAIAIRHHMKLEELLRLNGLNEEKARKLKPGDRLRIR